MSWKRPDDLLFPVVWERFEGKIPQADGKPLQYRIQDITEELVDPVIEHMCRYFLIRENWLSHDGFIEDEAATIELKQTWKKFLEHEVGLVAIVEGDGDESKRIAGCNMLFVCQKTDPKIDGETAKAKRLLAILDEVHHQVDVFERYGVDKCLDALGLSVAPQYQGDNVGYHLLKCRVPLCQACGIPLTSTVFTNPAALHQALKNGFEILWETSSDVFKIDDKIAFPRHRGVKTWLTAKPIPKTKSDDEKKTR